MELWNRRMRKIRSKRIAFYIAALALLILGGKGTDIGQLRPVEVVQLYAKGNLLFLKTDTGDVGWGVTVEEAVKKLKETTPGKIYLDTADYLLLEEGVDECLPQLKRYLKKHTKVVCGPEGLNLEETAAYLRIHRPSGSLGNTEKPQERVEKVGGKIILKKFKEK